MLEISVVRHGQAAFGTDDYDRLTEVGWEQSRLLGEYFANCQTRFDAVYIGAMRRHRETFVGLRDVLPDTPDPEVLPGLNEYDFHRLAEAYLPTQDRVYDMADSRDFYRCLRAALMAWSRDEVPGLDESWQQFEQRVRATMGRIGEARAPFFDQGRILVVTSGGASSAILRNVLGVDVATMVNLNLQAKNSGISTYFCKNGRFQLNAFNGVPHLEKPQDRHLITYT
ncbi:histidine phosphatase family protein [Spongiibacter sp. KMU-166]|uniref:Histidine phosphatase family protein n=1 Tax=Spongiibacter thalassae TaxID=2721624 RepID=A0ABX1GCY1_9GAMM|nr:histidine phosphatase family protein [Spongiibacter thalassae]NKI17012.1 histidine phosphatase family protein [Spongiibacter thalassae]